MNKPSDDILKIIDPFDEEDWDEIEKKYSIFKIWIGSRTRTIKIKLFPANVEEDNEYVTVIDDNQRRLYNDKLKSFQIHIYEGINSSNCIIVDDTSVNYTNVVKFITNYIKVRESSCKRVISDYENFSEEDYEDSDYNENELEQKSISESKLLENIKILQPKITTIISKLIIEHELEISK